MSETVNVEVEDEAIKNPIKKVAFFVEGLTEMIFLQKLLKEIITQNHYSLLVQKMRGGSKAISQVEIVNEIAETAETKCFVLITECGGDTTVKSYIMDNREKLIRSGYSLIVGIVDLYPKPLADLHRWEQGLRYRVPQEPVPTEFVIPVMEIEAWFIKELTHYNRLHAGLTMGFMLDKTGLNLNLLAAEDFTHPADQLNGIYQLVGYAYKKKERQIQRTVDLLDYSIMYLELPASIASLKKLIALIDQYIIA
jgi:hypothetical protein